MKFVCDNCKAKYQIGDDKVAGKTVRMKCRKCGYNIKVSPEGSEAPSMDMPSHDFEAPASMAAPVVPQPPQSGPVPSQVARPAPAPKPAAPARSTWGDTEDESTSIMSAPVRDAVAAAAGLAPTPHASSGTAPLRAPPAPRPVTTVPGAPRPAAGGVAPRPFAAAAPRPVSRQSSASMAAVQHDHGAHPAHHPAPQPPAAVVPEHEWYVGIAGSPIGPVRVSVIRERALANEVDGESLVWREGLSEWRPLRTVPELFEVVTAAQVPRPPPTPTPLAAIAATPAIAAPMRLAEPPPPAAAPAVVSAAPAALQAFSDPFAPLANGSVNGRADGLLGPPGEGARSLPVDAPPDPRPVGPAAASAPRPAAATVDVDPALEASLAPRRGLHPMAYAFIAAVAVFSGVAAYVLIPRPPPQIVIVTAPAPTAVPGSVATAVPDKGDGQVEVGDLTTAPSGPAARLGGPRTKASATPTAVAASSPLDTSSFINNVPGPAAVAPGGPAAGTGQLSQGEMSGVVAQNQPRVRRKCWQPALDGAATNAPKSARVTVQISIAAGGNVESASASGAERDFPGLASCIGGMVRGWKFPPSGGSTQVNVPFVFAGQ